MIPRGLLRGTPIKFDKVRKGDIIDTWSPEKEEESRFHRRQNQVVMIDGGRGSCDLYTDYDMICKHIGLWIQLVKR